MRINKPQLFNGQYLASNDAILAKLFGPNGFTSGAQVFSPAEGATLLSNLIPWSDIPSANIVDRIYGDTIKISNAEDAKTISAYIDEKFANVRTYSLTGDDYITATSSEVEGNVAFTLETDTTAIAEAISGSVIDAAAISITKSTDSDLIYTLNVNGKAAGTINIPEDQFLESGVYDTAKRALVLTFKVDKDGKEGKDTVEIPVSGLIKEFTAGSGIVLNDTVFSGVVDTTSEGFLTVGKDGFKLAGVQTAIDTASGVALGEAKAYTDAASGEIINYVNPNFGFLSGAIDFVSGGVDYVSGAVDFVSGAVDFVSGQVIAETTRATAAENYISGQVSGVAGYKVYTGDISALIADDSDKLTKVGSVKTYIDTEVQKAVMGESVAGQLDKKVDKTQIANTVSNDVASGLPTNSAVISYVTDYVGSHNGVYEAPAAWANPTDVTLTGLYVSAEGETKFWNGTGYVATSEEVAETFTDAISSAIPTVEAVKEYVSGQVDSVKTYVEGEVAATVAAVNTKAVEMLETNVIFGTVADAQPVSGTVPGRVIAVYGADEEQCYPSIQYKEGVTTIYADAPSAVYTVVYAKRIGQANGVLPAYPTAE